MTQPGWIGVGLLVVSVAVIVVEVVIAGVWSRRVSIQAATMSRRLAVERGLVEADVARLRASIEEMTALWQPYRRMLRWLRHPLVVALMQSYARRRAAR